MLVSARLGATSDAMGVLVIVLNKSQTHRGGLKFVIGVIREGVCDLHQTNATPMLGRTMRNGTQQSSVGGSGLPANENCIVSAIIALEGIL